MSENASLPNFFSFISVTVFGFFIWHIPTAVSKLLKVPVLKINFFWIISKINLENKHFYELLIQSGFDST